MKAKTINSIKYGIGGFAVFLCICLFFAFIGCIIFAFKSTNDDSNQFFETLNVTLDVGNKTSNGPIPKHNNKIKRKLLNRQKENIIIKCPCKLDSIVVQ